MRFDTVLIPLAAITAAFLLIPVVAVLNWPADFSPGYPKVQGLSAILAAVFVTSGLLFRRAALQTPSAARTAGEV